MLRGPHEAPTAALQARLWPHRANTRLTCRVTTRGVHLPLQMFLHQNPDGSPSAVGWGVRCAVAVAAGTFVAAFTGIVAANAEVPPRSRYTVCLDHFLDAAGGRGPSPLTAVRPALCVLCVLRMQRCTYLAV